MPISSITRKLAVTPAARMLGFEAFTSNDLWTPVGRSLVFGGQVIAQSLMAASQTVKDKDVHSQHCYFLLPASAKKPITYTVERLREGKSYCTRLVHAIQDGRTIFILMASFASAPQPSPTPPAGQTTSHEEHPGLTESLKFDVSKVGIGHAVAPKMYPPRPFVEHFQTPPPEGITPWGKAPPEEDAWKAFLEESKTEGVDLGRQATAIQDYINERESSPVRIAIARQQTGDWGTKRAIWLKPRIDADETPNTNTVRAAMSFMTDFQFIGTAARAVGLSGTSHPRLGMIASLDHSMHFYPLPAGFDPSAPLLHVMEAVAADVPEGRGVTRGRLYTEAGELVASTGQEGVVRAARGGSESPPGTPVSL